MAINKKLLEEENRLFRECVTIQERNNEVNIINYGRQMIYELINGVILEDGRVRKYDITSPVIQGEYYGVYSDVDYSVYDGIIKGKLNSSAVNDTTKITGTESGSVLVESTDDGYNTLYYEIN